VHFGAHSWGRLVDLKGFQFDREERNLLRRILVEPVNRLAMWLSKSRRNPHDDLRARAGGVGEQFAKVVVVRVPS
jgi:hypothetical protein